jgi:imidazole glycerol-phosphate synthase subunit HisH
MSKKILIVDYGVGNLLSVGRAFEHCGATVTLSGDPAAIADAGRVVLPGVGAFGDCVNALRVRGLDQAVLQHVARQRPLIGICVGMQMLFDGSEEFGQHQGLGLIPGQVAGIPSTDSAGRPLKVPHIGWSPLVMPEAAGESWDGTPLAGLKPGTAAYFVHSFHGQPVDLAHRVADALYGGRRITAAVRRGAVFGTQFHPEKSGPVGLAMLHNFLDLT